MKREENVDSPWSITKQEKSIEYKKITKDIRELKEFKQVREVRECEC